MRPILTTRKERRQPWLATYSWIVSKTASLTVELCLDFLDSARAAIAASICRRQAARRRFVSASDVSSSQRSITSRRDGRHWKATYVISPAPKPIMRGGRVGVVQDQRAAGGMVRAETAVVVRAKAASRLHGCAQAAPRICPQCVMARTRSARARSVIFGIL